MVSSGVSLGWFAHACLYCLVVLRPVSATAEAGTAVLALNISGTSCSLQSSPSKARQDANPRQGATRGGGQIASASRSDGENVSCSDGWSAQSATGQEIPYSLVRIIAIWPANSRAGSGVSHCRPEGLCLRRVPVRDRASEAGRRFDGREGDELIGARRPYRRVYPSAVSGRDARRGASGRQLRNRSADAAHPGRRVRETRKVQITGSRRDRTTEAQRTQAGGQRKS